MLSLLQMEAEVQLQKGREKVFMQRTANNIIIKLFDLPFIFGTQQHLMENDALFNLIFKLNLEHFR